MDLSKSGGEDEIAAEELRRRQQQSAGSRDSGDDGGGDGGDTGDGGGWCDQLGFGGSSDSGSTGGSSGGCDLPDCDCGGCDFLLRLGPLQLDPSRLGVFRLSALLTLVALVVPARAAGPLTAVIRGYRRWLTRFTPACPSHPSCSAYALDAVHTLGARRGLRAAARRLRACGRPGH